MIEILPNMEEILPGSIRTVRVRMTSKKIRTVRVRMTSKKIKTVRVRMTSSPVMLRLSFSDSSKHLKRSAGQDVVEILPEIEILPGIMMKARSE